MKFCKDCAYAIPPKNPLPRGVTMDAHVGWICTVSQRNMVTGEKVSSKAEPAIAMRQGPCGAAATLFTQKR